MDEELKQAIEQAKEQQPVEKSLEWYVNLQLKDVKTFIRANINSASRSFVAIGYYLKYIRDHELFTEDGYQNIWEFAKDEFGIGKSSASQFMSINDKFSKDGNSPILLEQYKDFSSSKLAEMLTMTDEQLEQVKPTTTIVEIRQIKKPVETVLTSEQELKSSDEFEKASMEQEAGMRSPFGYTKSVYPQDSLIASKGCGNKYDCFSCARICQIRQVDRYCTEAPLGHPYSCTTMNVLDCIDNDIGGDCMFINLALAPIRSGDKEPVPCCKNCRNICGYACSKAAHGPKSDYIPGAVNTETENVDNQLEIMDECHECSLNGNAEAGILNCHSENGEHKCWIDDEAELAEKVEADIIQPDKEYDFDKIAAYDLLDVKAAINGHADNLIQYKDVELDAPVVKREKMEYDALKLLEENMCMPELKEQPKPVQPELPALKNNDQRKAFIVAYASWPIWIDLDQTGERYYRYDLSDKVAMVVKVSLRHVYQGYKETEETDYISPQYYLLGIKTSYSTKVTYHEDPSRTFAECSSNMTDMVNYLKEFQKK